MGRRLLARGAYGKDIEQWTEREDFDGEEKGL